MTPFDPLYNRVAGCLYGQAVANAWAMPALTRPEHTWHHFGGWLETLLPAPADHPLHPGFKAGQFTADVQQALTLARAMTEADDLTVEVAAGALLDWYHSLSEDKHHLIDPSTYATLHSLLNGGSPQESGLRGDTAGAAAHISPVALVYAGDMDRLVDAVVTVCTPSHFTDVAISAACAVAAAISQSLVPETTLEDIIAAALEGADAGRQQGIPWMGAAIGLKIEQAVQLAGDTQLTESQRLQNLYDLVGSTTAATDAVPCAFGVLYMAQGNLAEAAIFAAGLSGNADTVGTIAGAIAGAWQGLQVLPEDYLSVIRTANPAYNIETLASHLTALARQHYQAPPSINPELIESLRGQTKD